MSISVSGIVSVRPCMWIELVTAVVTKVDNIKLYTPHELSDIAEEWTETYLN